jgi:hypothetical protein
VDDRGSSSSSSIFTDGCSTQMTRTVALRCILPRLILKKRQSAKQHIPRGHLTKDHECQLIGEPGSGAAVSRAIWKSRLSIDAATHVI